MQRMKLTKKREDARMVEKKHKVTWHSCRNHHRLCATNKPRWNFHYNQFHRFITSHFLEILKSRGWEIHAAVLDKYRAGKWNLEFRIFISTKFTDSSPHTSYCEEKSSMQTAWLWLCSKRPISKLIRKCRLEKSLCATHEIGIFI